MQIFKPIFDFWAERAQPGWAENPSARLGLITSKKKPYLFAMKLRIPNRAQSR